MGFKCNLLEFWIIVGLAVTLVTTSFGSFDVGIDYASMEMDLFDEEVSIGLSSKSLFDRKIFVGKLSGKTSKSSHDLLQIQSNIRNESLKSLQSLPQEIKKNLIKIARHAFDSGRWEPKLVTQYLDFFRTGNRNRYESKLSGHRTRMAHLMVGHLLDRESNKTSELYMDSIIDGLYMMLEESTWVYPAHLYLQHSSDHLPDLERGAVDLNAGEDAKFIAWVKLMFGEYFHKTLPILNQRIDYELRRRIFVPYLNGTYFWTGLGGGSHVVNNWNIWINGNILKAALFTLDKDEKLFAEVVNMTVYSADWFLNNYGDDGGCDEGPAYWRQAAGRLIEYLEMLNHLYGTEQYFKSVPMLRLMGEYSYKMHIHDNWYVNFADSIPEINYPVSLIAKYGQLFGDSTMKEFASYVMQRSYHNETRYIESVVQDFNEFWNYLSVRKEIEKQKPIAPHLETVWFEQIEVAVVRSKAEFQTKKSDLFLGAKAGTNAESHNHNDVGSFVLYHNDQPMLIDIGVGEYTAKTFGSHRFELFYLNSDFHNCPTINGVRQKAGTSFKSHNTRFIRTDDTEKLITDIAGTYPKEAAVRSWNRTIEFNRTANWIQISDDFLLERFVEPQQLHFMTTVQHKWQKIDQGIVLVNSNNTKLRVEFDWKVFEIVELVKSFDGDKHLTKIWGDSIKRITLVANGKSMNQTKGQFVVRFVPE